MTLLQYIQLIKGAILFNVHEIFFTGIIVHRQAL